MRCSCGKPASTLLKKLMILIHIFLNFVIMKPTRPSDSDQPPGRRHAAILSFCCGPAGALINLY